MGRVRPLFQRNRLALLVTGCGFDRVPALVVLLQKSIAFKSLEASQKPYQRRNEIIVDI